MMRGKTWFRCPSCGHVFKAPDFEDGATAWTMPWHCPKCKTKSYALHDMRTGVAFVKNLFKRL